MNGFLSETIFAHPRYKGSLFPYTPYHSAIVRAQGLVDVGAEVADFGPGQVPALDVLASAEEHGAF